MKRAAVVAVVAILGLALLVHRHVISAATLVVILLLAVCVLVFLVLILPNLKPRT